VCKIQITATAAHTRSLLKVSAAASIANTTSGTAWAPSGPGTYNTISGLAGHCITALSLDKDVRTQLAPIHWILRDLALSCSLATTAGLIAGIPMCPLRNLTVDTVEAAGSLAQRSTACETSLPRLLLDTSEAEAHCCILARRPGIPHAQHAI